MKKNRVLRKILMLQCEVLALVIALITGLGLLTVTAILLFKGGENVGAHLQLLGQFLPGYTVSWGGAFAGLLYGLVLGALSGFVFATIYNRVARLKINHEPAPSF